jgi:hypothetical protein
LGCTIIVALNKREFIKTNNAKKNNIQPVIKSINLLHEYEFILLNRIFFVCVCKNSSKRPQKLALTSLQQDVFIIATLLLSYGIRNSYRNWNVSTFLSQCDNQFVDYFKISSRYSVFNHAIFVATKLLIYVVFSILSTNSKDFLNKKRHNELSIHKKARNLLVFLSKF